MFPNKSYEIDLSEFLEDESGKPNLLDEGLTDYAKSHCLAVTISPPLRRLPINAMIYIDMKPFREYIAEGMLEVYPEFEKGRLHYHCVFLPKKERFGHDYQFWILNSGMMKRLFELKKVTGITKKTHQLKYKRVAKGFSKSMVYVKYANVDYNNWVTYCKKNSELTNDILGYTQITKQVIDKVTEEFIREYKLELFI